MPDTITSQGVGNKKLAAHILKRFERMKSERDSFYLPAWRSAAEWICPRKSNLLGIEKTPGDSGWVDNIFDITAMKANERLAAWLMTNTSPGNARWFSFATSPATRRRIGNAVQVDQWWQQVSAITLEILQGSNFYTQKHEAVLDRNIFGTCAMATFKGRNRPLFFRAANISTYVLAVDEEGSVDTFIRQFPLTAKQAAQQFGLESLGPIVRKAFEDAEGASSEKEFTFLHAVLPNIERAPEYANARHKPWKSCYVCKEDQCVVQEGGYDEMPWAVSRFLTWTGDTWGCAPAFTALPVVRETNFFKMQINALAELAAFPPMAEPDNMSGVLDLRAGARNVYDHNEPEALPKPLYEPKPMQLQAAQFILESNRKDINECFFGDVIAMFSSLEREVTAFEAAQLMSEKLDAFSLYYFRLINELDTPSLLRAFSVLLQNGVYPEPPPQLLTDNGDGSATLDNPEVIYLSRLALAIQAHEIASFDALLQRAQTLAAIDPALAAQFIKPVDLERAARGVARNLGIPVSWQRTPDEVAQINQAESDAAEQAAMANQAPQLARAAKDIDSVSPSGKNQLASLAQSP